MEEGIGVAIALDCSRQRLAREVVEKTGRSFSSGFDIFPVSTFAEERIKSAPASTFTNSKFNLEGFPSTVMILLLHILL